MPSNGTTDATFAMRTAMEKHREKRKVLHCVFIDLQKAYDRVPRQEIWRCMRAKRVPEKYLRLVQDMYNGARTKVRSSVGYTEWFSVGVGLHQGSALSPYLFNLIMDVMSEGIRTNSPWNMMFADDIVVCGHVKSEVEEKVEEWRRSLEERGLKINRKKTEHLCLCDDGGGELRIQGEPLKRVKKFKYLGSIMTEDGSIDE